MEEAGTEVRTAAASGGRAAVRGAVTTAAWTLGSRLLGFVRDALLAATFGLSPLLGAFALAWVVPNLFRRLFGEGAVSAAVQPALARAEAEVGREGAGQLYARFQGVLIMALGLMLLVGEALLWAWRAGLEPGPETADTRRVLLYTMLLLPYLLPVCLCALAGAPQNLGGRFLLPALAPALLNLVWIAVLLAAPRVADGAEAWTVMLAVGVVCGGVLQWLIQLPGVRASGWPLKPRFHRGDGRLRAAVRAFLPALLGMAAVQVNVAVDQVLVRHLVGPDANTYTYLANRLLHLPLALVGIAAMTGAMPLFARLAAAREVEGMRSALRRAAESTLLLTAAAGIGLGVVALPTVRLLFEYGEVRPEQTPLIAETLRAYLWVLPVATLGGLLTRAHQSLGSYRLPAIAATCAVPVNLVLDWVLLPIYGVPAAGWATAASLTMQLVLLAAFLPGLQLRWPLPPRALPGILAPGLAAGLAAAAVQAWITTGWLAVDLGLAIVAGGAAAVAATWAFRRQDLRELLAALVRS
jgi:putative peptidoglycan lipid II flippase